MPTFLTARRNTSQRISSGTWANNDIEWDIQESQSITYNPIIRTFELLAGITYRITAQLGWEAKTPEFYAFGLFNYFTDKQIGPLAEALPPNRDTCNASGGLLDVIYTPEKYGTYVIRIAPSVKAGPSISIRADVSTFLNVVTVDSDFLSAGRSTPQTIPAGETWSNKGIVMNLVAKRRIGIEYDTETGIITLSPGTTYRVTAQLGWEATSQGWYAFGLYDVDDVKQIGPLAEALPPNRNTCNASGGVLDVIFTPVDRTAYRLKIASNVSAGSSSKVRADVSTFLNIVEIPPGKSYLTAKFFTDQLARVWKDKIIKMNIHQHYGDIKYYQHIGVFTLPGGKTFRITAQLGWKATEPRFYAFGIFNYNTGDQYGPLAEALPPNRNTCNASGGVLDVILTTPARGGDYCLRMSPNVSADGSSVLRADVSTFMNIVEL